MVTVQLQVAALGPFPHGSRETGVDPLSAYGGFERLPYIEGDRYPSELADNGWVTWQRIKTGIDGTVGPIAYPTVRWDFNRQSFANATTAGWTVLHHATYLRGKFTVVKSGSYLATFSRIVSFKIDDRAFVGNIYGYPHASESAIYLEAGEHMLYVCVFMDVRLFGGSVPPKVSFTGQFRSLDLNGPSKGIVTFPLDTLLPDLLDDKLVTPYASVTVMNARAPMQSLVSESVHELTDGPGWVQVVSVRATSLDGIEIPIVNQVLTGPKLAPTQVLPIPFEFDALAKTLPQDILIRVTLRDIDSDQVFDVDMGKFSFNRRTWGDAYRITFYGYDGSIQYSMVRPPKKPCVRKSGIGCPIVVALHGGFDWHGPSKANVESAVDVLQQLAPGVPPALIESIRATSDRRIYVGHSNGGQGAWWMLTHYPDTALAGVPTSGYVKIQHYIPYYMHIGDAYADPVLRAEGIPILPRTGGDDDNVPPLHTRRIVRMMNEWSRSNNQTQMQEIPGKGHWFEGVLNDQSVQSFLDYHLSPDTNPELALPPLPTAFTIQTLNPASTGSKGGIRILQLEVPFRLATIRVHRNGNMWILNTTNVRRFGFVKDDRQHDIVSWSIDGTDFKTRPADAGPSYLKVGNQWQLASDLLWISRERHPSTYGPTSLIFSHPFCIVVPSLPSANKTLYRQLAQHIASSWYLYALGGTQIIRDVDVLDGLAAKYNLIVLGGPLDNLYTRRRESEGASGLVKFLPSGGFHIGDRSYEQPGSGILFLAPSPTRTRMGLFVAGVDANGLQRAAWSIPFRTGLEVPDYLVVGDEYGDPATGWTAGDGSPFGGGGTKGAGGVFAAGYWNNTWDYDNRCGYLK
eukprot:jgi/Hompol1/1087/HPOL_002640-RA